MTALIRHLESHLGIIQAGWKDSDGTEWPFQVVRFQGGPIANVSTYCTLGLSNSGLTSATSQRMIRHELFIMARSTFGDRNIPAILAQLGREAIAENRAFLRGDVIGPRGTLFPDSAMEALYVTLPVYFPDSFATCTFDDGSKCIFAWLVPILKEEAALIREQGWGRFEDILASTDPDLLDFARPNINHVGTS